MKRTALATLILFIFISASVCAEESTLTDSEAAPLNANNYRNIIENTEECVVLYYSSLINGTYNNDMVMKALMEKLPDGVKFFKVNLNGFPEREISDIVRIDIEKKIIPSIIPYREGFPLYTNKVRGPARKKWLNNIVSSYVEEFK